MGVENVVVVQLVLMKGVLSTTEWQFEIPVYGLVHNTCD